MLKRTVQEYQADADAFGAMAEFAAEDGRFAATDVQLWIDLGAAAYQCAREAGALDAMAIGAVVNQVLEAAMRRARVLETLAREGIRLRYGEGRLWAGPASRITPPVRRLIEENRADLLMATQEFRGLATGAA